MKLSEKKNSQFTNHPETDTTVKAVIVDVTDTKKKLTAYGEKDQFRLVFETEIVDSEKDRRHCIWSRGFTPSLDEKSTFRKEVKKIIGRELTRNELADFDTETLIGLGVKLIVQHATVGDNVYANITYLCADKDKPLKASGAYIRVRDRDQYVQPVADKVEASDWERVAVHIGKHKGVLLGDVDEIGVKSLIEKWLPKAKADGKAEDAALIAALSLLADILGCDDY